MAMQIGLSKILILAGAGNLGFLDHDCGVFEELDNPFFFLLI